MVDTYLLMAWISSFSTKIWIASDMPASASNCICCARKYSCTSECTRTRPAASLSIPSPSSSPSRPAKSGSSATTRRVADFFARWKTRTSRGFAIIPTNSWPKRIGFDIVGTPVVSTWKEAYLENLLTERNRRILNLKSDKREQAREFCLAFLHRLGVTSVPHIVCLVDQLGNLNKIKPNSRRITLGLTLSLRYFVISIGFVTSKPSSSATFVRTISSTTNGRTVRRGIGVNSNSVPWIFRSATCLEQSH